MHRSWREAITASFIAGEFLRVNQHNAKPGRSGARRGSGTGRPCPHHRDVSSDNTAQNSNIADHFAGNVACDSANYMADGAAHSGVCDAANALARMGASCGTAILQARAGGALTSGYPGVGWGGVPGSCRA